MTAGPGPRAEGEPPGPGGRRRVGLLVAAVPVMLFAFAVAFIALRGPAADDPCRHDHPREQVREWWSQAQREDVSVPGTRYVAFDDSSGCIYVGLEDERARAHLQRRFRRLGVPRDVVVYQRAGGGGPP